MNNDLREKRLNKIKLNLLKNCTVCKGTGITKERQTCICLINYERYIHYEFAGIEKEYWDITLDRDWVGDKVAKKYTQLYIKYLDKAYENGLGIIYLGKNGVGKTMLSNTILKEAKNKNYNVRNITLEELLKLIKEAFNSSDAKDEYEKMKQMDFLCLDNVGSEYKPKDFGVFTVAELDVLIRYRRRNLLPIIITSNLTSKEEFIENYGSSILSLLISVSKFIIVQGEDHRQKQGEDWENKLRGTTSE
jgi:DNA replication protein DnaC